MELHNIKKVILFNLCTVVSTGAFAWDYNNVVMDTIQDIPANYFGPQNIISINSLNFKSLGDADNYLKINSDGFIPYEPKWYTDENPYQGVPNHTRIEFSGGEFNYSQFNDSFIDISGSINSAGVSNNTYLKNSLITDSLVYIHIGDGVTDSIVEGRSQVVVSNKFFNSDGGQSFSHDNPSIKNTNYFNSSSEILESGTTAPAYTVTSYNSKFHDSALQQIRTNSIAEDSSLYDDARQYIYSGGAVNNLTLNGNSSSTAISGSIINGTTTLNNSSSLIAYLYNNISFSAENIQLVSPESQLIIQNTNENNSGVASVSELKNNGNVSFLHSPDKESPQYSQLNISRLSGNGLFTMNTSLADGAGDFLNITDKTDGKFGIHVMDSGKALVSNTTDPDCYHLIHAAESKVDTFTMTNKSVDLGAYKYYLTQDKNAAGEWYLSPTKEMRPVDPVNPKPDLSEPAKTALMIANALPAVWQSELSTLRARLGELRNNPQVNLGVWSKITGARHNINNSEVAYRHDISSIVAGGDKITALENSYLRSGVMAGYSHSSLKMNKNDGTIDSYSLGVYSTWQHKSGFYVDGVVKANHFRSNYDARFNEGKTSANSNTNGIGFSIGTGKYFEKESYFVEPYVMIAAFRGQSTDYRYSNDMSIKADAARSFSGEAGTTFGKNFIMENGTQIKPYIRVAVNHEFAKNGNVELNKQGKRTNDMSGTTGKYGIGIDAKINNNWAVYGEFNYANGSKQETPYSGFLGVNYQF